MQSLTLYTSAPADTKLPQLVQALSHPALAIVVLPIEALPAPRPMRLLALRVERDELVQDKEVMSWQLTQFASGNWRPDAGHENGLQADYDATCSRLRAVERSLAALEGGQRNG